MVKLYQTLEADGEKFNCIPGRTGSKFWNEGKFHNFIEPHLPNDCTDMTFVEMGCNAGLFLKMAKDKGFRNVVGVEKDKTPVREGRRYRDLIGYDYKIMKRTIGGRFGDQGNFDIDELPVADYTIMSTFHYYIDINTWMKYVDRLKHKTRFVVIVSRAVKRRHWRAGSRLHQLRGYFHDWKEHKFVPQMPKDVIKDDPKGRDIWSVSFESPLKRIDVNSIKALKQKDAMYVAMYDLAAKAKNNELSVYETDYYKQWLARKKGRWSKKFIDRFVLKKFNIMCDVRDNGLKDPLVVRGGNKLCDGGHRLSIIKALDYKTVIVRVI